MERTPGHGSRERSDFEEYREDGMRNKKSWRDFKEEKPFEDACTSNGMTVWT